MRALAERQLPGVVGEVLPVSMKRVVEAVSELVARYCPEVWLGVGLAAGRTSLSLEAAGLNLAAWDGEHADIDGFEADRQPVVDDAPAAYLTTLPVTQILDAWRQAGIPGYLSLTAGSYLCNASLYAAAHCAAELHLDCRVGFIHLPQLPELIKDPTREPSMSLSMQSEGVGLAIEASRSAGGKAGLYLRKATHE